MITATAEVLKGDQQIILRFYADGVEPIEPNQYETSVTVDCYGPVGIVKGAVDFENASEKILIGGLELRPYGIKLINYCHHKRWKVLEL